MKKEGLLYYYVLRVSTYTYNMHGRGEEKDRGVVHSKERENKLEQLSPGAVDGVKCFIH